MSATSGCPVTKVLQYVFITQVVVAILRRSTRNGGSAAAATEEKKGALTRYGISSNGRFSESISHEGVVYTSGQVGKGRTIQEATSAALADVDHALALAGTDKSKCLTVTIYLRNIERDYSGMNEVYDRWIAPGMPPCRATVQAFLADPAWLVEVHATASR